MIKIYKNKFKEIASAKLHIIDDNKIFSNTNDNLEKLIIEMFEGFVDLSLLQ